MAATAPRGRSLRLLARAGNTGSCNDVTDTIELFLDKPGTALRVSAGYADTTNDQLGYRHKGTEADGSSINGSGACGHNPGQQWANLEIELGNRDDSARLDARMPRVGTMDPLPNFVNVVIDGGKGDDTLRGHEGYDEMRGGRDDDVIRIAGGGDDFADCGPGHDKVIRDANDGVASNCEDVVG